MRPTLRRGPRRACARGRRTGLTLLVLSAAAAAQAPYQGDPFQPGLRWALPADPAQAAIPRAVALGATESVAWVAGTGATPGFSAGSAHAQGAATLLARDAAPAGATGALAVAAGRGPWLLALDQVPAPDALHRRTQVRGYLAEDLASGPSVAARWVHELAFAANGPARLACDAGGAAALVAALDEAASQVRVERIDAATGAAAWGVDLPATALQELAVSADLGRAALSAGPDVWVLAGSGGVALHAPLGAATQALALSGDGRVLAHGDGPNLIVRAEGGGAWSVTRVLSGVGAEIPLRAALARDGATLALAWWSPTTPWSWRFEVWSLAAGARLVERAFVGAAGGLQNLPVAVALTPDGARAAFACWGDGGPGPEAAIWDRASGSFVLEADLPGSALALALDAQGTRALVAAKSTHANVLSATGEVRQYDTGERDLQVLGQPRVGGSLHVAARRAGATAVLFLDGTPSPAPFRVPGVGGALRLLRAGLTVVRVPAGADGRADAWIPIPADPARIGTTRHLQAAFRVGGATVLGAALAEALVL